MVDSAGKSSRRWVRFVSYFLHPLSPVPYQWALALLRARPLLFMLSCRAASCQGSSTRMEALMEMHVSGAERLYNLGLFSGLVRVARTCSMGRIWSPVAPQHPETTASEMDPCRPHEQSDDQLFATTRQLTRNSVAKAGSWCEAGSTVFSKADCLSTQITSTVRRRKCFHFFTSVTLDIGHQQPLRQLNLRLYMQSSLRTIVSAASGWHYRVARG